MLFAHFTTSEGRFTVRLYDADAPKTVANFVGLAEGTKQWTDPRSGGAVTQPYYNGTIFHRVIDGFMIQGDDQARRSADQADHDSERRDRAEVNRVSAQGLGPLHSALFCAVALEQRARLAMVPLLGHRQRRETFLVRRVRVGALRDERPHR